MLAEGRASRAGRYSSDDVAAVASIVRVDFFAARFEQVVEFAASVQAFVVFPGVGIHGRTIPFGIASWMPQSSLGV